MTPSRVVQDRVAAHPRSVSGLISGVSIAIGECQWIQEAFQTSLTERHRAIFPIVLFGCDNDVFTVIVLRRLSHLLTTVGAMV
jgi:hypothetical protein